MVHRWLKRSFGKASRCENIECQTSYSKRFEWALIHGKDYDKERENFIQLCCSCHRKYDYTDEQKKKVSIANIGKKASEETKKKMSLVKHNYTSRILLDTQAGVYYETVGEAAKYNNLHRTTLSMMLTGKNRNRTNLIYA